MGLTTDRFAEFFEAVYGFAPFPWQIRLAERVATPGGDLAGQWPACLALPTGAGKTTCVDIAIFAMACQAHLAPEIRTAPRRIIFVVDRRVIVDEAFEHALKLARMLRNALRDSSSGILGEVARVLRELAGGDVLRDLLPAEMLSRPGSKGLNGEKGDLMPLTCHQLRGGIYRDDAWARTPLQPCVIASTVDQIGSRLLFRGYGCSFKSWPIHAGLAANDSLIILDEAHCATPFMETLLSVQRYQRVASIERVGGPFQFAIMSATPPDGSGEPFRIDQLDRDNFHLGRRITARKACQLIPSKAKGRNAKQDLAEELVAHAVGLINEHRQAIVILVNRVPTARYCHELLTTARDSTRKESASFNSKVISSLRKIESLPIDYDVVLMTGRMRPADKTEITETWLKRLSANASGNRRLEKPVIVIATQCLEVGANLDFDGMVSECASFDALRQRFGRLNRTGRDVPARGIITICADQVSEKYDDPIYGTTLSATWSFLSKHATDSEIDFGIDPMDSLWSSIDRATRESLIPTAVHAPVMLRTHLDMWCQTSPEPQPSPDPAVFLHGPDEGRPEVQVCWRADIPDWGSSANEAFIPAILAAVSMTPPTSMECLSVPLHVFRRWLLAGPGADDSTVNDELSDAASGKTVSDDERFRPQHTAIVWRGTGSELIKSARDLRPGQTIVLPATAGGFEVFGHLPDATALTVDIGDHCFLKARERVSIRLHPALLAGWLDGVSADNPARLLVAELCQILTDVDQEPDWDEVLELVKSIASELPEQHWLRLAIKGSPFKRCMPMETRITTEDGRLRPAWQMNLRSKKSIPSRLDDELELTRGDSFTGDDETDSSTVPTTLLDHTEGVRQFVNVFADCSVPRSLHGAFQLAATLHDLGKADQRFQAFLLGGNRLKADMHSRNPLAKSGGSNDNQLAYSIACERSGLPKGFRHEMLSVQLAEEFQMLALHDEHRDLILHLIASHHGYGRPFAPVVIDDRPASLDFDWHQLLVDDYPAIADVSEETRRGWVPSHRLDSGIGERFWRLVRRYGWWGLAWLEAVFILADRRRSEAESYSGDELFPKLDPKPTLQEART